MIYGRLKQRATSGGKHLYHIHEKILKALIETDKTVPPAYIKYQERGKMMFPHSDLLPFAETAQRPSRHTSMHHSFTSLVAK